jgi:hypothetical protein
MPALCSLLFTGSPFALATATVHRRTYLFICIKHTTPVRYMASFMALTDMKSTTHAHRTMQKGKKGAIERKRKRDKFLTAGTWHLAALDVAGFISGAAIKVNHR